MELNQQSIAAYKTLLTQPKEHGLDFLPWDQVIVKSDKVLAKHILYQQYCAYLKKPLPKVVFYILLIEMYCPDHGYDQEHLFGKTQGCLGYYLKIKDEFLNINQS